MQVELSSVDELESNESRCVSVNESSSKNQHRETDVVDKNHQREADVVGITAAEFESMSVDEHTQTPETVQHNVPTQCSAASADSQAAVSPMSCTMSDVAAGSTVPCPVSDVAAGSTVPCPVSDVAAGSTVPCPVSVIQSPCTDSVSSVAHSDSSTQCVSPTEPTGSEKAALSGRQKRNRNKKKNVVTESSSNTSVRRMYFISCMSQFIRALCRSRKHWAYLIKGLQTSV